MDIDQRRLKYKKYLKSSAWKRIRRYLFKIRGHQCEEGGCDEIEFLEIHHLTYDNIFEEKMEDLKILCRGCHREVHNMKRFPLIEKSVLRYMKRLLIQEGGQVVSKSGLNLTDMHYDANGKRITNSPVPGGLKVQPKVVLKKKTHHKKKYSKKKLTFRGGGPRGKGPEGRRTERMKSIKKPSTI